MLYIILWTLLYDVTVASSILLLGNPLTTLGALNAKSLALLLLDWRFLLGGILALCGRFMFIIINNLAAKHPSLASAHLSLTAIATMTSIIMVLIVNHFVLGDQLTFTQLFGVGIILIGLFFVFR